MALKIKHFGFTVNAVLGVVLLTVTYCTPFWIKHSTSLKVRWNLNTISESLAYFTKSKTNIK